MARTVRFYEVGGPEVLKIDEVPSRLPGRREITLRVQAVGLNRAESMFRHRYYLEPTKFPATLGYEAAGVGDSYWFGCGFQLPQQERIDDAGVVDECLQVPLSGSYFKSR